MFRLLPKLICLSAWLILWLSRELELEMIASFHLQIVFSRATVWVVVIAAMVSSSLRIAFSSAFVWVEIMLTAFGNSFFSVKFLITLISSRILDCSFGFNPSRFAAAIRHCLASSTLSSACLASSRSFTALNVAVAFLRLLGPAWNSKPTGLFDGMFA